jgi:hypothetical protein
MKVYVLNCWTTPHDSRNVLIGNDRDKMNKIAFSLPQGIGWALMEMQLFENLEDVDYIVSDIVDYMSISPVKYHATRFPPLTRGIWTEDETPYFKLCPDRNELDRILKEKKV